MFKYTFSRYKDSKDEMMYCVLQNGQAISAATNDRDRAKCVLDDAVWQDKYTGRTYVVEYWDGWKGEHICADQMFKDLPKGAVNVRV